MKKNGGRSFRLLRTVLLSALAFAFLSACSLTNMVAERFKPTFTPMLDPITPTPDQQNCAWTWAYGDGSPEFDAAVSADLEAQGMRGYVVSSSFGENNSCDNSFAMMSLDVVAEIVVEQLSDPAALQNSADALSASLQENLSVSGVPNLGNVTLTFVTADSQTCFWDFDSGQCAE